MAEFLYWQVRNLLALRGFELAGFVALVVSGVGLYYSLKFIFCSRLQHVDPAIVFSETEALGGSREIPVPLPESGGRAFEKAGVIIRSDRLIVFPASPQLH